MTIEASLTCDACACIVLAAASPGAARRELRGLGGRVTNDGDFCPQCVAKGYADPSDPRRVALRQERERRARVDVIADGTHG